MTLKVRRILSLIFIILFLTAAPAVILYAAGFKLGRNGFSIERTGMIIIDSRPRGAKIFLNGKPLESFTSSLLNQNNFIATPAKIKNILPGEYKVSLELDGYWDWRKKLTVKPGASTFAENIYLFKNNLPAQLTSADAGSVSFSPDKKKILVMAADALTFYSAANESEKIIKRKGLEGKTIAWSGDGQKIVIDDYLYDLNDINSETRLMSGGYGYKWNGGALYFRDKTSLYRQSNGGAPQKIISDKEFQDYFIKDGYLYLIAASNRTADLEIMDLASGENLKKISLPAYAGYSFINPGHNLVNIYDQDHEILYLINAFSSYGPPLAGTINNVKTAFWNNSDALLYTNDFEIWLYNLAAKRKSLITRISDPIKQAIMHPAKNYIVFSTEKTIKVIELDDREKRSITELVKFDSIGQLTISPKGDILYFSGRIGNLQGLYKLLLI